MFIARLMTLKPSATIYNNTEFTDLGAVPTLLNLEGLDSLEEDKFKTTDLDQAVVEAFQIFDSDKTGMISKQALRYILVHLGHGMSEDDADELIHTLMYDQDNEVDPNNEMFDYMRLFSNPATNA